MVDLFRRTRILNLLFGISLLILTILIIYFPLRNELIKTLLENWTATAKSNYFTYQLFNEKSIEGARGISSRSVIRDAIIQYKNGQLSWDELVEFTKPKFEDGISVLDNLVLASRLVEGKELVLFNLSPDHIMDSNLSVIPNRDGQTDVYFSHDKFHLIVYSDFQQDGEILGTDILIYDMTPLLKEMNKDDLQVEIIDLNMQEKTDFGMIYSATNEYQVTRDMDTVHYIQEIDPGRYYLHLSTPYKDIIGSSQTKINFQLALYILGVLLLFILFNMVILRQANQLLMESENSRDVYKKFAYQDTLTNAYSRLSLDHWLVDQKKRKLQSLFSIVMLDIDSFKFINDAYGHQVGDEVLIMLANTINAIIRKDDFLVRYGGDEFLIILDNAHENHAAEILNRIQLRLDKENIYEFPIRISYGIVEVNSIQDYEDAVLLADQRMYTHKKSKNKPV